MNETQRFDEQLGYVPAIPLPFYGRMKWWKLWQRFSCPQCDTGWWREADYERHYVFTHIPPADL